MHLGRSESPIGFQKRKLRSSCASAGWVAWSTIAASKNHIARIISRSENEPLQRTSSRIVQFLGHTQAIELKGFSGIPGQSSAESNVTSRCVILASRRDPVNTRIDVQPTGLFHNQSINMEGPSDELLTGCRFRIESQTDSAIVWGTNGLNGSQMSGERRRSSNSSAPIYSPVTPIWRYRRYAQTYSPAQPSEPIRSVNVHDQGVHDHDAPSLLDVASPIVTWVSTHTRAQSYVKFWFNAIQA
jgi:hypothetical protein